MIIILSYRNEKPVNRSLYRITLYEMIIPLNLLNLEIEKKIITKYIENLDDDLQLIVLLHIFLFAFVFHHHSFFLDDD